MNHEFENACKNQELVSVGEPFHVDRVRILHEGKEKIHKPLSHWQSEDIKESFLQWAYKEKRLIMLDFWDEQIKGFISGIEVDYIVLEVIDNLPGKRNGYIVIRKEKMTYIDVDEGEENGN